MWRTPRQARKFLEKKKKEKEAGEERLGDDDEDVDAEDGDGDGDGDGGDQGDGPGEGEGAPGANRDEGMGAEVSGLDGEEVAADGLVVGEGEGGVSSGGPAPRRPRKKTSLGTYKETKPMYLRLTWNCEGWAVLGLKRLIWGEVVFFNGVSCQNLRLSGLGWGLGMSPKDSQSLVQVFLF